MSKHFKKVFDRVSKRVSLLKAVAGTFDHPRAPPSVTISIYKTMIRPIMEYAPLALMLLNDKQFEKLDSLRTRAYKIAYGIPKSMNGNHIKDSIQCESPKSRIETLAKKYIDSDKRAPSIRTLIDSTKNKMPLRMLHPLYSTPIDKVQALNVFTFPLGNGTTNWLKKKHSLVGKNLLPLFARFNVSDDPKEFARFSKEERLEDLDTQELAADFKRLTGENLVEVLAALGKSDGAARMLAHHAIIFANEIGQPAGQSMKEPAPSGSTGDHDQPPRKVLCLPAKTSDQVKTAKSKALESLGFQIQDWEFDVPFNPEIASQRKSPRWTTIDGQDARLPAHHESPAFEDVLSNNVPFDTPSLPLRDPNHFVAGQPPSI
ncbi:uncharacterized protein LOC135491575 [Lineus longissimus]|uniref:uncharacterized protein LOC135491575 n=1 Tax=Lineus longissimus TaxID=88925 RepID=UPI00315CACD4